MRGRIGRDSWRIKAYFLVEGIPWTQMLTMLQEQLSIGFMPGRAETMIWAIYLLSRLRCPALTFDLGSVYLYCHVPCFWWELLSS